MVLQAAFSLASSILPSKYYIHAAVSAVVLVVVYAFSQGRATNRERDLHARVILVTGAFSPLGLALITSLASRGAQIIAISSYPLDHAYPSVLIPLLRSTTNNENIFAEHAELSNPASIREFCTRFLTGQDQRLDAIVFAHEYHGIGSLFNVRRKSQGVPSPAEQRETSSLATFLMVTLLLPALLVEPVERDIRIVNVVNPFYAASATVFGRQFTSIDASRPSSLFVQEGTRALRTAVLTRHLQRVLDSLPNRAPAGAPPSNVTSTETKNKDKKMLQKDVHHPSNIIAVSVSPGISRKDTIAPLFGAERNADEGWSLPGFLLYIVLLPLLVVITKSPDNAIQSVLHALFLPTPMKRVFAQVNAAVNSAPLRDKQEATENRTFYEEVLKPGALYRECAVVQVALPPLPKRPSPPAGEKADKGKAKGKAKEMAGVTETASHTGFTDDGEFGGETMGRAVWEWYEDRLKKWEAQAKERAGQREQSGKEGQLAGESSKTK
ncbi:uncharacterized protein LAESUDRAFT_738043 [Laetiporus sulphureus 93-53]|uniref:Ketoreductase (KR) domain-containing protein n=1 Tax=Laetiporus sulphureus 93-53 TaxID=1314785 RepID=A0A165D0D1_9APHY|nr:uncharacterized protein LAESUDRAFT_738043 [Laetiporus sulphureus 93-53]KZT03881.1 hypothetical protein LAESUDRAFT_738043 [Laetiporus sulphureus 93-53]